MTKTSKPRRQSRAQERLFLVPQRTWQARFYDFNMWSDRKRIEKLRYMHRNPVKRGLVASPDLWRWSSFRSYGFGEAGPVRLSEWEVLQVKMRAQTM